MKFTIVLVLAFCLLKVSNAQNAATSLKSLVSQVSLSVSTLNSAVTNILGVSDPSSAVAAAADSLGELLDLVQELANIDLSELPDDVEPAVRQEGQELLAAVKRIYKSLSAIDNSPTLPNIVKVRGDIREFLLVLMDLGGIVNGL